MAVYHVGLHHLLRPLLVVPEAGLAHLVFKFFAPFLFARQVKESPGSR